MERTPRSESRLRMLLIDRPEITAQIAEPLTEIPECELHVCSSPSQADAKLKEVRPDLLYFDHNFVNFRGRELLRKASAETGTARVIISVPQELEREYILSEVKHITIQPERRAEEIIPIIKKIVIQLLEEHNFVVSALSCSMRDFLIQDQDDELLSMLAAFQSDQEILHYRIVKPLGEGGMAEVYKAEDLKHNRTVALKVLPLSASKNDHARRRFAREAQLALSLNHPNIVRVFAIDESEGLPFLVMEYLQGESLRDLISHGSLSPDLLFDLGAKVADGLAAAHAVGLIHRDLKPANIMILPERKVKILDFGLAKQIAFSGDPDMASRKTITQLTAIGVPIGTTQYMSPEQTRGEELDFRSDIFSLGTVLYEAATGRRPFEGNTIFFIMNEIVNKHPAPPSSLRSVLPQAFDQIFQKATAKNRTQRYTSAAELAAALRQLISADMPP